MELVRIQKKNLPKKFKDNEVNLPNVPKEVVIERIKLGHCEYKTLHPRIKFQSTIYSPWSNANVHQFGSNYQFCDTGPETRSEKMRKFLKTEERTKQRTEIPARKYNRGHYMKRLCCRNGLKAGKRAITITN